MDTLWHAMERAHISVYGPTTHPPEGNAAASAEEKPALPAETPALPGVTPASTAEDVPAPSPEAQNPSQSHASGPPSRPAPASSFNPLVPLPVTRYISGPFPIPHLPGQVQYIDTIKVPFSDGRISTWEISSAGPAQPPSACTTQSGTESSTPNPTSGHTLRAHPNRSVDVLSSNNLESPLLRLAPELRNKIYRYALVSPNDIAIPSQSRGPPPPEPGLLATCRQIRSEAKAIYYLENKFHFEMPDYDASAYIKWCQRSTLHYKSIIASSTPLSIPANNRKTWENIMIWLEARYEQRVHYCPGRKQVADTGLGKLVGQLRMQFRELRDKHMSWSTIREDFERSRRIVALFDPAWGWEE